MWYKSVDWEVAKVKIVLWAGFLYIFIFYLLKSFGIIKTPLIITYSPLLAALITIFYYLTRFFDFIVPLKRLPKRVDNMAAGLIRVEKDVEYLKNDSIKVNAKLDKLCKCRNYKPVAY